MKKAAFVLWVLILIFKNTYSQNVNGTILSDTGNVSIVKVWGTHQERGYAVGYLLGNKIKAIYTGYIVPAFGSSLPAAKSIINAGVHIKIDSVYINEAKAVIQGMTDAGIDVTGVDYLDLLVANSFLDLEGLPTFKNINLKNGCSSLMSWGNATEGTNLDGKSVISRHLDWTPNSSIINNQAVIIHIPSEPDEQPWLLIGFAGQISVLSGVNSSGLSAFQHMLSDFTGNSSLNKAYEPIWFSLRNALEKTDYNGDGFNNTQDVKDALLHNMNSYADGFIVASLAPSAFGTDSLIAQVAELTPTIPRFSFRSNEYPDTIPGDNLYAANSSIKRNNAHNYCSRYNAVATAIENGLNISDTENWNIMKNYSNSGTGNIQFMQFIPELDILKLSVHKNGQAAYLHQPAIYDLNAFFQSPLTYNINKENSNVKIYPNPSKSNITICFSNPSQDIFNLIITDYRGLKIKETNNIRTDRVELSFDELPCGIYFLSLKNENGITFHGKIIW
ncbi:MAG: T9SS type A sorting domain-containing protein [Bacteroidia bacterium]|nr:T9SS type A sorting domain-containing protein [Bacteroidia bacterium]